MAEWSNILSDVVEEKNTVSVIERHIEGHRRKSGNNKGGYKRKFNI